MNTLDLCAAAQFLGLHPNTLQARAKAGEIPGAKIGKEWRFLDVDLADYMRSQYPANKRESAANRAGIAAPRSPRLTLGRDAGRELDELLEEAKKRSAGRRAGKR